ncbi:MAG: dihydrodipicolinate synthase family protein [Comamonadaceae bacterium]|nr:dihydrodipicolinate synthase family protein [Comamonadaceae bacterium]
MAYGHFNSEGYSAILSVSPYYNKPNQTGLYLHYKALNDAAPLPVIMYNVPGRTGMNVSAETTIRIAQDCKRIIATKEASGNFDQINHIIKYAPEGFSVISGDDGITLPMIALGRHGRHLRGGQRLSIRVFRDGALVLKGRFCRRPSLTLPVDGYHQFHVFAKAVLPASKPT